MENFQYSRTYVRYTRDTADAFGQTFPSQHTSHAYTLSMWYCMTGRNKVLYRIVFAGIRTFSVKT